ncbi:Putative ribosomal N-acetyltransferase YdaF [Bacillus rhizoplanae]|uniref:Ribosomal N-acetyltransferase YdaF n=1 Tax=Bacillus rhizoplanae TaxID=2880966 RepID=A0ABN7ZX65_9BACI|nr:GNAT family N-acetyltransferase [Bacillus rhizoplanae]CAG9613503.1 Putative ribosomal N-acetyltransferase YdaF [Bacillus rhizoplanae]
MEYKNIAEKYPILITERLCLRPLTIQDAPDIFEYASDPEMTTYIVWYPHEKLQDSQVFIQSILHQYEKEEIAAYGIELKKEKKIIGTCGFIGYDKNHHKAELAYALSRNYWGQGFATEAAMEFIHYGFETLQLNRIEAGCHASNVQSERVMKRLGMQYERTLRKDMFVKGTYRDTKIYAILRDGYNTQTEE